MHPDREHRRKIISSHLNADGIDIVEIGALHHPTFRPDSHKIKFIDYKSRDDLLKEYSGRKTHDPASFVHVDYVIGVPNYSQVIQDRFDLAIANHVIEHIPDTIRWLEEIRGILRDGGHLFLSIPDRRYTFDFLKRESNFVDVYRAYSERQTKASAAQLLENSYLSRKVTAEDCWNGIAHEKAAIPNKTLMEARAFAEKAAADYVSTHCHTYTFDSFKLLFEQLQELDLVHFDIVAADDVDRGSNEFHVLLKRR